MKKQPANQKATVPFDRFSLEHFMLVSMGRLTVGSTADKTIKMLETPEIAAEALKAFSELNIAINGNEDLLKGKFEEVRFLPCI